MDKKRKVISGLKPGNHILPKGSRYFTELEKHQIIQDYLSSGCSKRDIWEKYTGYAEEHGSLLRWMRELGYAPPIRRKKPIFAFDKELVMSERTTKEKGNIEELDVVQLREKIAELERQLEDAQMKAIAFSTMVDIAEQEFNIPIRKKYTTKPSKQ